MYPSIFEGDNLLSYSFNLQGTRITGNVVQVANHADMVQLAAREVHARDEGPSPSVCKDGGVSVGYTKDSEYPYMGSIPIDGIRGSTPQPPNSWKRSLIGKARKHLFFYLLLAA